MCNGYRDCDLAQAAEAGHTTVGAAYEWLGNGPCCGRCVDMAQEMLDAVHNAPATGARPGAETVPQRVPEPVDA
ncbi:MAG TPA: (2Fe-2S)-binding protein [Alphaproteobacteria bacterium]|nr:(2Fe-2S)-binding protein [Alphaproteobacteria bacterium]